MATAGACFSWERTYFFRKGFFKCLSCGNGGIVNGNHVSWSVRCQIRSREDYPPQATAAPFYQH